MKITGKQEVSIEIDDRELACAIMQKVLKILKQEDFDDAGCDWLTGTNSTKTYVADRYWLVSEDPKIAGLIDAVNIILYGEKLKVKEE